MTVFMRPTSETGIVESARKAVRLYERWGRWGALCYFVLGLLTFGLAYGVVRMAFEFAKQPQLPGNQGAMGFGFTTGLILGIVAGILVMKGFEMLLYSVPLFFVGDQYSKLLVEYHDTVEFLLGDDHGIRHDLSSAPDHVRGLLEKRTLATRCAE